MSTSGRNIGQQKRKSVAVFFLSKSTFVKADLNILSSHYQVHEQAFFNKWKGNTSIIFQWLRQLFWIIRNRKSIDILYCWFVDYHALMPAWASKVFNIPLVCVLGGFDTVNIPKWKHGLFESSWRAPIGRYVYKNADLLLPVSKSLIESENSFTYQVRSKFGVKQELKNVELSRIESLPTGYDVGFWETDRSERDNVITTVAFINSEKRVWIKGIDLFINLAGKYPEYKFQIVGVADHFLPKIKSLFRIPNNLLLIAPKSEPELKEIYQHSKIYMQLSRLEGFPNVLCEAILAGCVPVGSAVFGIEEIISNERLLVEKPDIEDIAKAMEYAIALHEQEGQKPIQSFVQSEFSIEKRERRLIQLLNNLCSSNKQA